MQVAGACPADGQGVLPFGLMVGDTAESFLSGCSS